MRNYITVESSIPWSSSAKSVIYSSTMEELSGVTRQINWLELIDMRSPFIGNWENLSATFKYCKFQTVEVSYRVLFSNLGSGIFISHWEPLLQNMIISYGNSLTRLYYVLHARKYQRVWMRYNLPWSKWSWSVVASIYTGLS